MLSLRIALRYLFARKSHSAVNIISLISVAGVAVATMAIVCVLSVFNGFSEVAASRLSKIDPALKVERRDGRVMADADSIVSILNNVEGVESVVPTIEAQALAVLADRQVPVRLKGVADGYDRVTGIGSLVIDGEYIDSAGADSLAATYGGRRRSCATVSIGVAAHIAGAGGINGLLGVYVPRRLGHINPANPIGAFAADSVVVSGVYEVEQPEYDADMVLLPIEDVRALLEYDGDEAGALELAVVGDENAVAERVKSALGDGYTVKTRVEQQSRAMNMIAVEKWISLLLLAFILVIASFNIISTLSILIIEKEENIATLTALGAPRRLLSRIFMAEGWLISVAGGLAGTAAGVALCLVQQRWGLIKLAGDASRLTITSYPVAVRWGDLLVVAGLVVVTGLISTLVTRRFIRARTA